jgi:rRNA maturation protein Nop10
METPEPSDHIPLHQPHGDALYESYRAGIIQRHICANGRVDDHQWLQERPAQWKTAAGARPRVDYNRRRGSEEWIHYDCATGQRSRQGPRDRTWWPMSDQPWVSPLIPLLEESRITIQVPRSLGGGDNPLLSTGLALAAFSLEARLGVSTHSFDYARQLFRFIENSQDGRGFLLRSRGFFAPDDAKLMFASTDEYMGAVVGLLFYYKACVYRGDDTETQAVRQLVTQMADNLGLHGYWLLPNADYFQALSSDAVEKKEPRKHRGWIFAYPLRRFFEFVIGTAPRLRWDPLEYEKYFGTAAGVMAGFVDLAERAAEPPSIWDLLNPLGAIEDALHRSGDLVLGTAELVEDAIRGVVTGFQTGVIGKNLWWLETEAVRHVPTDSLEFFLLILMTGEILPAVTPFGPLIKLVERPLISQVESFNFHLLGLAAIIALETAPQPDRSAIKTASVFMQRTVMGTRANPNPEYSQNAFLALIARYCARGWQGSLSQISDVVFSLLSEIWRLAGRPGQLPLADPLQWATDAAADSLLQPDRSGAFPGWQHGLPLGPIVYINGIKEDSPHTRGCERYTSVNELCGWNHPTDYNPDDRWGENRTWEHKDDNHVYWRISNPDKMQAQSWNPGPSCEEILRRHRDASGLDIKMEGSGLDLLFPRMLAAHWSVHPRPTLQHDYRWPTLPHVGATGKTSFVGPRVRVSLPATMSTADRHYNKRIATLRRAGSAVWERKRGWWHYWSREWLVFWNKEAFRGSRSHRYNEHAPFGLVGEVEALASSYYLEFATERNRLDRVPEWEWAPRTTDWESGGVIRLAGRPGQPTDRVRGDEARLQTALEAWFASPAGPPRTYTQRATLLEVWNDWRVYLPQMGHSSFYFFRMRIRVPLLDWSVGNEGMVIRSQIVPFWRRYQRIADLGPAIRFVLNPHTGVVHDVTAARKQHFQRMEETGNILALPVDVNTDLRSMRPGELETLIWSVMTRGESTGTVYSGQPIWPLPRKDHYRLPFASGWRGSGPDPEHLPPKRLRAYHASHSSARQRYEDVNTRKCHLCSYCF